MIRLIAAIDDECGLSANGKTPWHEPADLEHFRRLTRGATVLMSRGTFEVNGHPMPGRVNVVATHNAALQLPGCRVVTDVPAFLGESKAAGQDVWVIGGAEVFAAALPFADEIHLTHIPGDYACDAFFPSLQTFKGKVVTYELADLQASSDGAKRS